jgi:hypothetical protein
VCNWIKPPDTISDFLELASGGNAWIVKRLSGNDTGATGGHGAGLYFPKWFAEAVSEELGSTAILNPDVPISKIDFVLSGYTAHDLRFIYYNNRFHSNSGSRNEHRITRWGGRACPVQDPDNTGAIAVFLFNNDGSSIRALALVAENAEQEASIEQWLGNEVFPGEFYSNIYPGEMKSKILSKESLPPEWMLDFPSGSQIFSWVLQQLPYHLGSDVDALLMRRRKLEFELFQLVEDSHTRPLITSGFSSVEAFVTLANRVTNRRKSRTGKSLELNLANIFCESKIEFESQVITENRKKPDFIFPSGSAYHDSSFSVEALHMLAAKTCCKDRWRQVVNEANRIEVKHLFTLQEGVSSNQLQEMSDQKIQLVIPAENLMKFPKEWRRNLLTLTGFIDLRRSFV